MNRTVEIVGVPMDLGTDRRGVDMGPSAIRYGGIATGLEDIGLDCTIAGDLSVPNPKHRDPETVQQVDGQAKYLAETAAVCQRLANHVDQIRADGRFPLVLGGDHSIAIGTTNGIASAPTGVLWFDAHGDFNTPETTPSGNVHGMALAAILGEGVFGEMDWAHTPTVSPSNVALVGIRDLDETEREHLHDSDISVFTMSDIDERGIASVVREAIGIATADVEQFHVSFDLDFLDPNEAPGVGTPVRGGASYREAHTAMELLHEEAAAEMTSLELVEVNPILDQHNRTAELASEIAASALGDRIY